ncbi:MAG: AAA family ATPase, partial [Planktothrix sp.]
MTPFEFNLDRVGDTPLPITANLGDILFVLGANGTGKSSLMQRLYRDNASNARWIYAHRQNWFNSNAISLLPQQKENMELTIQGTDTYETARWKIINNQERSQLTIYNLIDFQNNRNRLIAEAIDRDDVDAAKQYSKRDNLVEIINEIFKTSNIKIKIYLTEKQEIFAQKYDGSSEYSIAELSDGERNALLIAADVLTAKASTLLLIDEPERHLHRSIISPLLTNLFSKRRDCTFVISTHEVMLPLDNPKSKTLLLRGCTYTGSSVSAWDVDLMLPGTQIDEEIKKDILGARRKILFIEGEETSLDKPLYSLIFPNVSIIAKSSCVDVEHTVSSIRNSEEIVWIKAFGIVDNDRRPESEINQLRDKGVYALPIFSVESIYYHTRIQKFVNQKVSEIKEGDENERLEQAKISAIKAIRQHIARLSARTAEKA